MDLTYANAEALITRIRSALLTRLAVLTMDTLTETALGSWLLAIGSPAPAAPWRDDRRDRIGQAVSGKLPPTDSHAQPDPEVGQRHQKPDPPPLRRPHIPRAEEDRRRPRPAMCDAGDQARNVGRRQCREQRRHSSREGRRQKPESCAGSAILRRIAGAATAKGGLSWMKP